MDIFNFNVAWCYLFYHFQINACPSKLFIYFQSLLASNLTLDCKVSVVSYDFFVYQKRTTSKLSIYASDLTKLKPPHCLFYATFMTNKIGTKTLIYDDEIMETLKNSWELRLHQILISSKICLRAHNKRL